MYREGHLYYYYLRKTGPVKRYVPQVSHAAKWVESNAAATSNATTKTTTTKPTNVPKDDERSGANFWEMPMDADESYDDNDYYGQWSPWTDVRYRKGRTKFCPFGRQGYRL